MYTRSLEAALIALVALTGLAIPLAASAQHEDARALVDGLVPPVPTAAAQECHDTASGWYGSGQACWIKFQDGTRCVYAAVGSGAGQNSNPPSPARAQSIALECDFPD